jgi:dihydrodipicolinate synthase/N-acetylneuraminate lyase
MDILMPLMTKNPAISNERERTRARYFPEGIPALWCPMLTHYTDDGALDRPRMGAHFTHLSRWIKGFLIPGSTGDAWEMNDAEARQVLEFAVDQGFGSKLHLLIGVLKTNAELTRQGIVDASDWLKMRMPGPSAETALQRAGVCGFTVCAPKGPDRSEAEIEAALGSLLELGAPTALYQLPQVTQNEISPGSIDSLARRFSNLILFKDSSGADRVARECRAAGVFLVRGAEGDYVRWLKGGGGPYDGLLLSTANCFAQELQEMIECLTHGRIDRANAISSRLTEAVKEAFSLVAGLRDGNPFANANKAIDHFFAHGPKAERVAPPRLHAGSRLPESVIRAVGEALSRHGFMPKKGYLE